MGRDKISKQLVLSREFKDLIKASSLIPASSVYIAFPTFLLFAAYWKWKEDEETIPYAKVDLVTGKQELDEEEKAFLEAQQLLGPRPKWKQIWDAL